ncbi:thioredoxin-like protein [Pelagophyceae sp. CCMP2097]|nr:thioredoxin-like protein [Pelagophyceae sp. CCMP2097]
MLLRAIFALALASASGAVVELHGETFEHQTQAATGMTTGKWLVKFHAPWCGHCKKLAPVLDELAEKEITGVVVAKVDCTLDGNKDLAKRFDIGGYPTLLFFADRQMYKYAGARTLEALEDFVSGGYLGVDYGVKVPTPPSPLVAFLESTVIGADFIHIFHFRKAAAGALVGAGVFLGVMLLVLLRMVAGRGEKAKKA